MPAARAATAPR